MRALPYLVEQRDDIVVVVVGHVFDDTFLKVADELGVRSNVIATGEVPKDVVPTYVAAADVEGHDFHNFGLGTASLEVMAAGVPVVSVVREDNFPGLELRSWENVVRVPENDPPCPRRRDPEAARRSRARRPRSARASAGSSSRTSRSRPSPTPARGALRARSPGTPD